MIEEQTLERGAGLSLLLQTLVYRPLWPSLGFSLLNSPILCALSPFDSLNFRRLELFCLRSHLVEQSFLEDLLCARHCDIIWTGRHESDRPREDHVSGASAPKLR